MHIYNPEPKSRSCKSHVHFHSSQIQSEQSSAFFFEWFWFKCVQCSSLFVCTVPGSCRDSFFVQNRKRIRLPVLSITFWLCNCFLQRCRSSSKVPLIDTNRSQSPRSSLTHSALLFLSLQILHTDLSRAVFVPWCCWSSGWALKLNSSFGLLKTPKTSGAHRSVSFAACVCVCGFKDTVTKRRVCKTNISCSESLWRKATLGRHLLWLNRFKRLWSDFKDPKLLY